MTIQKRNIWLPRVSTYSVISPRIFLSGDTMVADLIDSNIGKWKNEVIDNLFIDHEADLIKSIPLSAALSADKLVWVEMNNGKFIVGSAYKFALLCLNQETMELLLMVVC